VPNGSDKLARMPTRLGGTNDIETYRNPIRVQSKEIQAMGNSVFFLDEQDNKQGAGIRENILDFVFADSRS